MYTAVKDLLVAAFSYLYPDWKSLKSDSGNGIIPGPVVLKER